jgi:catechol 2,3-dioxygenase-like lactoylglutathione lyase family enzyme
VKVKGVSWVGVKTRDFDKALVFFTRIMGLPPRVARKDFVVFRMADGSQLEVFGPRGPDPPGQFASNPVVIGFKVEDIEAACRELQVAGVELIGPTRRDSRSGGSWQHFRGPDGLVYELNCTPSGDSRMAPPPR